MSFEDEIRQRWDEQDRREKQREQDAKWEREREKKQEGEQAWRERMSQIMKQERIVKEAKKAGKEAAKAEMWRKYANDQAQSFDRYLDNIFDTLVNGLGDKGVSFLIEEFGNLIELGQAEKEQWVKPKSPMEKLYRDYKNGKASDKAWYFEFYERTLLGGGDKEMQKSVFVWLGFLHLNYLLRTGLRLSEFCIALNREMLLRGNNKVKVSAIGVLIENVLVKWKYPPLPLNPWKKHFGWDWVNFPVFNAERVREISKLLKKS